MRLQLHPQVPITVISGARTWLDAINRDRMGKTANLIKEARPDTSYVGVEFVADASHHVYAEKPEEFNRIVLSVLDVVDAQKDGGGLDALPLHWSKNTADVNEKAN